MRTFASLRARIMQEVSTIIDEVTTKSDGIQLGLYILNTEEHPIFNVVLNNEGLAAMLEAAGIKEMTCYHLSFLHY